MFLRITSRTFAWIAVFWPAGGNQGLSETQGRLSRPTPEPVRFRTSRSSSPRF